MNEIRYFCIADNEDGTYELSIKTDIFSTTYNKVKVQFGADYNPIMVMPTAIEILDQSGNTVKSYSVAPQGNEENVQDNTQEEQNVVEFNKEHE